MRGFLRNLIGALFLLLFVVTALGQTGKFASAPLRHNHNRLLGLILIDHVNAQPNVAPDETPQQMWAVWPTPLSDFGTNRMLSLLTGIDWQGSDRFDSFRHNKHGWVDNYFNDLKSIGYFHARDLVLGTWSVKAISAPAGPGIVSRRSILLSLHENGKAVVPVPYHDNYDPGYLYVFVAKSWDEQSTVQQKIEQEGGRTLTLEIPSIGNTQWGRIWLSPIGWPSGFPIDPETGVAGLIRARSAAKLLIHPHRFPWKVTPSQVDSPAVWFTHVRLLGPGLLAGVSFMILFVIGCGMYSISIETKGHLAAILAVMGILTPAVFLAMDNISRFAGLNGWPYWLLSVSTIMGFAIYLIFELSQRYLPKAHPLFGTGLVGLLTVVICNPKYSIYSGIFGYASPATSAEAFGILAGYFVLTFGSLRNYKRQLLYSSVPTAIILTALAITRKVWWGGDAIQYSIVPIVALLASLGWLTWPIMLLAMLIPNSRSDLFHHGVTWAPLLCFRSAKEVNALNLGRLVVEIISPSVILLSTIIGGVFTFSDPFIMRQLRRSIRHEQGTNGLLMLAIAFALMALMNPNFLASSIIVAIGWVLAVCFNGVWSTEPLVS